jgi:diguanylate cyclase (GGDEF)-like protein
MQRGTTRKFSTPPGTRDILPPESTRLLDVQARILERFRLHGFREVITPALEYSEVVEEPKLRDASFKLFDPDNQMLLLRPEMTTPIARLVTQRLRNAPTPHKLSYALPVYRRTGVGRGQSAEFHQAGVEVVGSTSPGEDAGTIALLIETLESLGLRAPRDFVVVLGQTAFYEGYLRRVAPEVASELLEALAANAATCLQTADLLRSLRERAATDPLTGLGHHATFHETLANSHRRPSTAVVLCDIDGFKRLNDTFGHQRGDAVLRAVAGALGGALRRGDTLFRIGGDEFAALVAVHGEAEALEAGLRLRAAVGEADLGVTVSIGAAVAGEGEADAAVVARADRALYDVKARGRDGVAVADPPVLPPLG